MSARGSAGQLPGGSLRPTQPVVDPVVIRAEPVPDTPDDRLGAALHLDLPVNRADVALHRVFPNSGIARD